MKQFLTSQKQLQNRSLATSPASCSFCRILNLYDFKRSNFLATRTNVLDTPVSCDNSLKDVRGDASKRVPISSNVYSERKRRVCCRFLVNIEPIVRKVFTICYIIDLEGQKLRWNTILKLTM
jgi:hypothetical protein